MKTIIDKFLEKNNINDGKGVIKKNLTILLKNAFEAGRALTFEEKEVDLELALDMTEIQIDYFNFYDYLSKTAEL
jgi:hypothetical protein